MQKYSSKHSKAAKKHPLLILSCIAFVCVLLSTSFTYAIYKDNFIAQITMPVQKFEITSTELTLLSGENLSTDLDLLKLPTQNMTPTTATPDNISDRTLQMAYEFIVTNKCDMPMDIYIEIQFAQKLPNGLHMKLYRNGTDGPEIPMLDTSDPENGKYVFHKSDLPLGANGAILYVLYFSATDGVMHGNYVTDTTDDINVFVTGKQIMG